MNPVAQIRTVKDGDVTYGALSFVCPGCKEHHGGSGLHMLPVNTADKTPQWTWNGDLDHPTLEPSILTRMGENSGFVCHSYLRNGVIEFLSDCTHSLAGQHVPLPPLEDWMVK